MRIALQKVKRRCAARGLGLREALARAGVSRNAFYSLARKESVLPGSVRALAATLEVSAGKLLAATPDPAARMRALARAAARIAAQTAADPENVRHTLLLLEEQPVERLRRALRRGRQFNLRRR